MTQLETRRQRSDADAEVLSQALTSPNSRRPRRVAIGLAAGAVVLTAGSLFAKFVYDQATTTNRIGQEVELNPDRFNQVTTTSVTETPTTIMLFDEELCLEALTSQDIESLDPEVVAQLQIDAEQCLQESRMPRLDQINLSNN